MKHFIYLLLFIFLFSCSSKENKQDNQDNNVDTISKNNNNTDISASSNSSDNSTVNYEIVDNTNNEEIKADIKKELASGNIIEIRDRMFINQCNDIYLNPNDYKGKLIKIEGIYDGYVDDACGERAYFVYWFGPGCCGLDGVAGFEFVYNGKVVPEVQDWVEVIGAVEIVNNDSLKTVRLNAISVNIKDERGKEFVAN